MGYFDFFETQDGTVPSVPPKPKPKKTGIEVPPDFQHTHEPFIHDESGQPLTYEAPPKFTPKYPVSPERASSLQKRNAADLELKNEALKIIQEASKKKSGLKDKQSLAFGGFDMAELTKSIYGAKPGMYARVLRATLKQIGSQDPAFPSEFEPALQAFEQRESQLLKDSVQIPQLDIGKTPEKIAATKEQVAKAKEDLKFAVSEEQKSRLNRTIMEGESILGQPGGGEPEKPETVFSLDANGDPEEKTLVDAAENAGVPEADFNKAVIDVAKTMGLDLDRKVPLGLGLARILNRPEFAEARPDFEALGAAMGMPGMQQAAAGEQPSKEGEAHAATVKQIQSLESQGADLMVKIAAQREWKWYEVISFALLSMLIKPQIAALLFSRESEMGRLDAQLAMTKRHIARLDIQEKRQYEEGLWNRRQASQRLGRQEDDDREFRQAISKEILDQWLTLQRQLAVARSKPVKDETAKTLLADAKMHLDFAAKYSQGFDDENAKASMLKAVATYELYRKHYGLPEFQEE